MKGGLSMGMGDRIKYLRLQADMTQEQLGEVIGVQKSAIRKYEKGEIENIKRSSIKKMADLFGVSPCYLMGFDEDDNSMKIQEEVKFIEQIQKQYGESAVDILRLFMSLNTSGKKKAIETLEDLSSIQKYIEKESD